jgi:hypothetical protein
LMLFTLSVLICSAGKRFDTFIRPV